jgi:hypothetical protein
MPPPLVVVASIVPGPVVEESLPVAFAPPLPDAVDEAPDPLGPPWPGPDSEALQLHVATNAKNPARARERNPRAERRRCERVLMSIPGRWIEGAREGHDCDGGNRGSKGLKRDSTV